MLKYEFFERSLKYYSNQYPVKFQFAICIDI